MGLRMAGNTGLLKMPMLKLIHILGYAGLLPFIMSAGLLLVERWFGFSLLLVYPWGPLPAFLVAYFFTTYSAIILSFMSGTLWANGQGLKSHNAALGAILMSNILALLAWFALLLGIVLPQMLVICLLVLMFGYVSLLWVERSHNEVKSEIESAYWLMRLRLSFVVLALHLLMIILLEF
jgi:hypothetical protein